MKNSHHGNFPYIKSNILPSITNQGIFWILLTKESAFSNKSSPDSSGENRHSLSPRLPMNERFSFYLFRCFHCLMIIFIRLSYRPKPWLPTHHIANLLPARNQHFRRLLAFVLTGFLTSSLRSWRLRLVISHFAISFLGRGNQRSGLRFSFLMVCGTMPCSSL